MAFLPRCDLLDANTLRRRSTMTPPDVFDLGTDDLATGPLLEKADEAQAVFTLPEQRTN